MACQKIEIAIVRMNKLKNCSYKKFNHLLLLLLFTALTSCHSSYLYYISDNHDGNFEKVADTMGIKVYLWNILSLQHQVTSLEIERDSQSIEFKDVDLCVYVDTSKCLLLDAINLYYGKSSDCMEYQQSVDLREKKQFSDVVPDYLKKTQTEYKRFRFFSYFTQDTGYDSELAKNVQIHLSIRLAVNNKDITIKKVIGFIKTKHYYTRFGHLIGC